MAAQLNQYNVIGRVGKDPEQGTAANGDAYTRFSLAVDDGKEQKPLWLNVTCWRTLAENMQKMLKKGALVFVTGKLRVREYKDKNNVDRTITEVAAADIQVLKYPQPKEAEPEPEPEPAA